MSQPQENSKKRTNALSVLASLLSDKKEIKSRVKNGESLKAVAQEKVLKVVLPL